MGEVSPSMSHTPEIIDEVFKHLPIQNYLSWAFYYASSNESSLTPFSKEIAQLLHSSPIHIYILINI
jgi:hypothetical protein